MYISITEHDCYRSTEQKRNNICAILTGAVNKRCNRGFRNLENGQLIYVNLFYLS